MPIIPTEITINDTKASTKVKPDCARPTLRCACSNLLYIVALALFTGTPR
jgi:hypothetical protein